jgi:hypothetical protein
MAILGFENIELFKAAVKVVACVIPAVPVEMNILVCPEISEISDSM